MKIVRWFTKLALLMFAAVILSVPALSQPSQSSDQAGASATTVPEKSSGAKQAAGEDDTAQFKQSFSVKWIAKMTGLSLNHAYWLAVVLNFVLIVSLIPLIIKLIVGSNLATVFRNRTALIQKSLEEARKASDDANRRLSEIESRLGRLGDEISQMKASSEKEAAAEEERIKAAAEEDARRIVQSAEQEISSAAKAARRELTAYAADLAISLAAREIRVDASTDQRLVRRFAQQLSDDGGNKNAEEKN